MASLLSPNGQRNLEVGVIGREGMTGLSVVMVAVMPCSCTKTFIQIAGNGARIAA